MKAGYPIRISAFAGMNNIQAHSRLGSRVSPSIIWNMDTVTDETLKMRDGYSKFVSLNSPHSLYSNGTHLYCSAIDESGVRAVFQIFIKDKTALKLFDIGTSHYLYYCCIGDELYISSRAWRGIWDIGMQMLFDWGIGNIDIPNRDEFYESTWLDLMDISPAKNMEYICLFGSRIWGAVNDLLVYTDPFLYKVFRDKNAIQFGDKIVMIAISPEPVGLYIATNDDKTWFLAGSSPETMILRHVGSGAVENTLQYCNFVNKILGANTPIWVSKSDGIVAGVAGSCISLTANKVNLGLVDGRGASLFRMKDGQPQYLANIPLTEDSNNTHFGDKTTIEVFRNGKLIS